MRAVGEGHTSSHFNQDLSGIFVEPFQGRLPGMTQPPGDVCLGITQYPDGRGSEFRREGQTAGFGPFHFPGQPILGTGSLSHSQMGAGNWGRKAPTAAFLLGGGESDNGLGEVSLYHSGVDSDGAMMGPVQPVAFAAPLVPSVFLGEWFFLS